MSKCVGLLGGVGVGASVHYYRELAAAATRRGEALDLVMIHIEMAKTLAMVGAGDRDGMAEYLNGIFLRMKAAGAEVAVIPSVTTHYPALELARMGTLKLVDLFPPLSREMERRSMRRVSLFGTKFVMESGLYGRVENAEFVLARPEEREYIHETYMKMAFDGFGTAEQYEGLRALAKRLIEREGLDAIVLAGTDLAMIFNEGNTDFPYLDCAALHLKAIEDEVFGG